MIYETHHGIKQQIVQIEPQKGKTRYLIASRRDTLYRTQYNIHASKISKIRGNNKYDKTIKISTFITIKFTTVTDDTTKGK
jgi:hypothetical protein